MGLSYDDVYLIPRYSEVASRSDCDTSVKLGDFTFDLPVIPANMRSVINIPMAKYLARNNLPYAMHRFGVNIPAFINEMDAEGLYTSISMGVNFTHQDLHQMKEICGIPKIITLDIAHGHSLKMRNAIKMLRHVFKKETFIVAGNVCTTQGTEDLIDWGADALKIGVGPGSVCITKLNTGFTMPQFTAVLNCVRASLNYFGRKKVPIIADGGISNFGAIPKALLAGADLVMSGFLFRDCLDSGEGIVDGKKEYYGSASARNKGHNNHNEGKHHFIEPTVTVEERIKEIKQHLQSAISYAGGSSLKAFYNVKYGVYHRTP